MLLYFVCSPGTAQPVSHTIKNTVKVVVQPETEHSNQSCLKPTPSPSLFSRGTLTQKMSARQNRAVLGGVVTLAAAL